AMRIKLLASTAAPTSISNLSRPLTRHRFIPRPRNKTEIPALDADPKWLCFLECRAALQGFLLRCLLSSALRDAHLADLSLLAALHIVGTVKATISGVPLGRALEGLPMTLQRG